MCPDRLDLRYATRAPAVLSRTPSQRIVSCYRDLFLLRRKTFNRVFEFEVLLPNADGHLYIIGLLQGALHENRCNRVRRPPSSYLPTNFSDLVIRKFPASACAAAYRRFGSTRSFFSPRENQTNSWRCRLPVRGSGACTCASAVLALTPC